MRVWRGVCVCGRARAEQMRIEPDVKLDFKDVLIRPKRSTLQSRAQVSLERTFVMRHAKKADGTAKALTWCGA